MGSPVRAPPATRLCPATMITIKILTFIAAASVLVEARRTKKLHSAIDGDLALAHHPRLQLHKGASNSIHHGPKYASLSKHDKLAKKKAKYYKKLLGHKGEHQAANTRHDLETSPCRTSPWP